MRGAEGVVTLEFDAPSEKDAILQASGQGCTVLSVRERRPSSRWSVASPRRFSLLLFSQELLALLNAGLTLLEALETLAEKGQHTGFGKVLQAIIASLREGNPFSHALQNLPEVFPHLYIASVRASEKTGDLAEALTRFIQYQTQMDLVRKKFVSASIYPVLLITVGALVTLFLMIYVVPKFSQIYEDLGGNIPIMSQLLIHWGRLVEAHSVALLAGAVGAAAGVGYGLSHARTRAWLGKTLWQAPLIGERLRVYQLARFYRTLGMLLRGGMPVVSAMEMASGLLPLALRGSLHAASRDIQEGRTISDAMLRQNLTTPVAFRMLRVGERSGAMGSMMDRIASFYDEEMARWMDWFMRLFEPLLMTVIGAVVGTIVALMYMPIFELAGSLQ